MSTTMIYIREPTNPFNSNVLVSVFIYSPTRRVQRIVIWNAELAVAAMYGDSHPKLVGFDEWKYLFVSDCLYVP